MMAGIEVLNKELIYEMPMWAIVIPLLCILVIIICVIICHEAIEEITAIFSGVVAIVCVFVIIVLEIKQPRINTGRYRYEVTINESVSFDAVLDKYEVIEQKGKIWILEDKECE